MKQFGVEIIFCLIICISILSADDGLRSIDNQPVKDWTFIAYMAADNNLAPFSRRNLRECVVIGSTDLVNIVVHLDTRIPVSIKKQQCKRGHTYEQASIALHLL